MSHRSKVGRRGRFETLESRQLLAGDVVVDVVNGRLSLEGDIEANKVMIAAGDEAGAFVITGLDGTTLDDASDPITVTGVRHIHVDLGAGDDLVALVGANVRGNVSIETGEDADRVLIGTGEGAAELAGVLPADLSVHIRGKLRIDTGAGADQVAIDDAVISRMHVDVGDDNDIVSFGSTAALGDLDARLAVRGGAHVRLGGGNDEFHADQVNSRFGIVASGGEGDDTFDASAVKGASLLFLGDGGLDDVTIADADVRLLGIHTGADNDNVEVRDSTFKVIGVSLGDGNDLLTTANLEAKLAWLVGGDGEDTLDNAVASTFEHSRIVGFEIPPDVNSSNLPGRRFLGRQLRRLLH